jgi:hypothetical protein
MYALSMILDLLLWCVFFCEHYYAVLLVCLA